MNLCSKCGNAHDREGQRHCRACHAAYMREWRKDHPLTGLARLKDICRSIANVYLRRGKIERRPCEVCGSPAEMHHDDYDKPLAVRWLCRPHHLALHRSP